MHPNPVTQRQQRLVCRFVRLIICEMQRTLPVTSKPCWLTVMLWPFPLPCAPLLRRWARSTCRPPGVTQIRVLSPTVGSIEPGIVHLL
jgi:hypothetical protein